jgi:hypothetical protein
LFYDDRVSCHKICGQSKAAPKQFDFQTFPPAQAKRYFACAAGAADVLGNALGNALENALFCRF